MRGGGDGEEDARGMGAKITCSIVEGAGASPIFRRYLATGPTDIFKGATAWEGGAARPQATGCWMLKRVLLGSLLSGRLLSTAPAEEANAAERAVVPPGAEEAKPCTEGPVEKAKAVEPAVVPPAAEEAKPCAEAPVEEAKAAGPAVLRVLPCPMFPMRAMEGDRERELEAARHQEREA